MPLFEYTAINSIGKQVRGTIDADTARQAQRKLQSQSIFPTEIHEGGTKRSGNDVDLKKLFQSSKIPQLELSVMTRQLATLISAGLPLTRALLALSEQTQTNLAKKVITDIREQVEQGSAFAIALAKHKDNFSRLFINMVAAGESSGTLDTVLAKLADHLEEQIELRRKIRSAITYPVIMLIICSLVITGLFMFVVPTVVEIFQKQGAILPLPTRVMLFISNIFVSYWWLLLAIIFSLPLAFRSYYASTNGRHRVDLILLKTPLLGPIYTKIACSRIATTLGALLTSGVGLLTALEITSKIITNSLISKALENAKEGVQEGRSLAKELNKSQLFPPMLSHMVAVGETSGALEDMLRKAGSAYKSEVDATLDGLTSIIEPLLMVVVGGIVLCIVISVLLPFVDLIDVIQKKPS